MTDARLNIYQIAAGPLETNVFLVVENASRKTLIVDAPPESLEKVRQAVEEYDLKPEALLITHGHWDHVQDTAGLKKLYDIPVFVHELDRDRLEHPSTSEMTSVTPDRILDEGDTVALGEIEFMVWHTPGHSPGQISLISLEDRVMLGGDTLFPNGYGTVEIPGADRDETVATIRRLLELPDDVVVFPGHGMRTTIGQERRWMEEIDRTGVLF